ncbi:glycerophosphocholine acyltransferase [Starmerella bacillaris]|uniref:Glycerophosphocholine acyltransferase 1 n=1 Tax=Starmerella bacillaris TaxID=1247836 RepID=A0AAV5RGK8_STABA|nr:glycerophosphocholine acyltransferase [Starmerella bacillaris]
MSDISEPGWLDLLLNIFIATPGVQMRHHKSSLSRVKQKLKKIELDPRVTRYQRRVIEKLNQLDELFSQQKVINQTQKLWYTMSLLNILFLGVVVAHLPHILHIVYTVELSFLLPVRFYTYSKKNYQYFMADLCYFVNFLLVSYIWIWPNWSQLWVACFAFSFGTLAISVALWRNSLVMQSIDKTTSTFIHLLPPLVCYTINFRLNPTFKLSRFPGAVKAGAWQTVNSIIWTTAMYFVWQSLYHFFITVRKADNIRRGTTTSFEYMRKRFAKARIGLFVNSLPGPLPVIAFTLIQFTYSLVTMAPCPLYYRSELLSQVFLIGLFSIASYNGATFYIDVYGNRLREEVARLQAEVSRLQDDENELIDSTASATSLSTVSSSASSNLTSTVTSRNDDNDPAQRSSSGKVEFNL